MAGGLAGSRWNTGFLSTAKKEEVSEVTSKQGTKKRAAREYVCNAQGRFLTGLVYAPRNDRETN